MHSSSESEPFVGGPLAQSPRASRAQRAAGLGFVKDPMGAPQIPNWNRVTSALPAFLAALREAVEADSR